MIYLNEVCRKLAEILNDDGNPTAFLYDVQSVGFHLDNVYDKRDGRNRIMVFVSSMGGSFNPVYGLGENTASIPITIYFPVRFKDEMYALDAYLHSTLVGADLQIGNLSGKAISNLSVAVYGEIQDLDLKEFSKWSENVFRKPIEIMEPYMSLTLNLYLSSIGADYLYGNSIKASLQTKVLEVNGVTLDNKPLFLFRFAPLDFDYIYSPEGSSPTITVSLQAFIDENYGELYFDLNGQMGVFRGIYKKNADGTLAVFGSAPNYSPIEREIGWSDIKFASGSLQQHAQSTDQQVMGEYKSEGLPFSVTNGQSFSIFLDKGSNYFLYAYFYGTLPYLEFDLKLTSDEIKIDLARKVYIQSFNMPINKGQPLTATITLADRMEA